MAWSFTICLALLAIAASSNGIPSKRAVGGVPAENGQFPYFAAIKYNDLLRCGGAIISPKKILTAASCLNCAKEDCLKSMTVIAGSTNFRSGNVYRIKDVKIYQDYDQTKFVHDIGVITLESEIEFSENAKSVDLPNEDIVDNVLAVTGGWGIDSKNGKISDVLKTLEENIISREKCSEIITNHYPKHVVDDHDICAVPIVGSDKASLCAGDGGVPLVYNGKVVGISASGIGCAEGYPDVFTNVYKHIDFIKSEL